MLGTEAIVLRYSVIAAVFIGVLALERAWPLRQPTAPKPRRMRVNFGVAAVGAAAAGLGFSLVVLPAASWAEVHGVGLLRWGASSIVVRAALSVVLLDATLWGWHWLNHHVPFLWRFHAAHHADVDLDASTAVRFHFGELVLSVPYRTLQVVAIGVDASTLVAWEGVLLVAVILHHSNVRLPYRIENALRWFVITPRLHGIHHSVVRRELHSNYGTLFSLWDVLWRTQRWGISDETIRVGLPDVREAQSLGSALTFPFARRAPR